MILGASIAYLERYPAETLDGRSRELLLADVVRELAFHRAALVALESSNPEAPELDEWRQDVADLERAEIELSKKA